MLKTKHQRKLSTAINRQPQNYYFNQQSIPSSANTSFSRRRGSSVSNISFQIRRFSQPKVNNIPNIRNDTELTFLTVPQFEVIGTQQRKSISQQRSRNISLYRNTRTTPQTQISFLSNNIRQETKTQFATISATSPLEKNMINHIDGLIMRVKQQKQGFYSVKPTYYQLGCGNNKENLKPNYLSKVQNINKILLPKEDQFTKLIPYTCDELKYSLGPLIGKGSYASVYLGYSREANKFAIKVYQKSQLKGERIANLINEIQTMKSLKHEQIVQLYDVYSTDKSINLVMDYCGNQSLYQFLKQQPFKRLQKQQAVKFLWQLLNILNYMHERGVCHRDIKLENILVQQDILKLIDFGFSTFSHTLLNTHCGTPSYMPPEITLKIKYDGKASDIWAAGVLFACLVQGSFPFRAQNEKELFRKIRNGDLKIETKDSDILQIINQMLTIDPKKRANAKDLLMEEIFQELKFI